MLHVLYAEQNSILANQELIKRKQSAPLSAESVYSLILAATGDSLQAEKAQAYFLLQSTKGKK